MTMIKDFTIKVGDNPTKIYYQEFGKGSNYKIDNFIKSFPKQLKPNQVVTVSDKLYNDIKERYHPEYKLPDKYPQEQLNAYRWVENPFLKGLDVKNKRWSSHGDGKTFGFGMDIEQLGFKPKTKGYVSFREHDEMYNKTEDSLNNIILNNLKSLGVKNPQDLSVSGLHLLKLIGIHQGGSDPNFRKAIESYSKNDFEGIRNNALNSTEYSDRLSKYKKAVNDVKGRIYKKDEVFVNELKKHPYVYKR